MKKLQKYKIKKIHELAIHELPKKKKKQNDGPKRNIRIFYHPIDIRMVNNQILNLLQKHKKVAYHFLPIGLLFSGGIKNNTNQTFIVFNGLSDACDSF